MNNKDIWGRLEDRMEANGISVNRAENLKALSGVNAAVLAFERMSRASKIREKIARDMQLTQREKEIQREKVARKLNEIEELCSI